jgi:hypothetical protein
LVTVACFLPGWAKNLSAPSHINYNTVNYNMWVNHGKWQWEVMKQISADKIMTLSILALELF